MQCSNDVGIYRRRKPQETSLWKLLNGNFIEFEGAYDEFSQQQYGFYRPVISHVVYKHLECGYFFENLYEEKGNQRAPPVQNREYTEPVEIAPCDGSWPGYEEAVFEG